MRKGRNVFAAIRSMVSILAVLILGSGCLSTVPVRLTDKPSLSNKLQSKNLNVALVVRDDRSPGVKRINMCGVNYQTAFHIPVAPVFLAHAEHLDSIVAHHAAMKLEKLGYTVKSQIPASLLRLSENKVNVKEYDKKEVDAAWSERKIQKQEALTKEEKNKRSRIIVTDLVETNLLSDAMVMASTNGPWGEGLDLKDVDLVVEMKINKFWTDYSYYGAYSWMSVNYAVCSAHEPVRKVLYGKRLKGIGFFFGPFTPLSPIADVSVSMNTAYWFVLNQLGKELESEEFEKAIRESHPKLVQEGVVSTQKEVAREVTSDSKH